MKIYIKQKGRKYFIHQNQETPPIITGYWEYDKDDGLRALFYDHNGKEILKVSIGKCPWIGGPTSYLIHLINENNIIEVELKNRWKSHYKFKADHIDYDFYEHFGHKKSLFKGESQVAKFDKAIYNWGERDSGYAIFNSDEKVELILGLWIMKDMGEWNEGDVSADFGNINFLAKEWNNYWTPKR
ncbi:hypothetical protein OO013_19945 [Mangrovivirga sp. M17]|uniref:Uncharacterized protein n=1 Tax=Mangrovivirga halotolerans TaxID=2993936 RepID=A0ABT3RWL4_9BACT|nr:hypothetical protein [Mangrovivirga halotolerans]MCX2746162.1 hypothetical protein [Mangrovivirga halotolerans]